MITLPPDFVATKYNGYFWHLQEQRLYSIKVAGVLRPMSEHRPNFFNKNFSGYIVSVKGQRRRLWLKYLKALKAKDSIIPIAKVKQKKKDEAR